jgi:hypothetical protein
MIAMKHLAIAAVAGCAAIAAAGQFAPGASAGPQHATFTISFDYDAGKPAEQTYAAFQREARRACTTPGLRPLDLRRREDDCVADAVDAFVRQVGRTDIAAVHFDRTGRRIDSSRILAAR